MKMSTKHQDRDDSAPTVEPLDLDLETLPEGERFAKIADIVASLGKSTMHHGVAALEERYRRQQSIYAAGRRRDWATATALLHGFAAWMEKARAEAEAAWAGVRARAAASADAVPQASIVDGVGVELQEGRHDG